MSIQRTTTTPLILALGAALAISACGTTASDGGDRPAGLETEAAAGAAAPARAATRPSRPSRPAAPEVERPVYRDVTIPSGTRLVMALTNSVASDTSSVEDAVTAELTSPVSVDGRDVLPVGTRLTGIVTDVDDSDKVKGRARIAFRFTSLLTGSERYDVESASVSHEAAGSKKDDAVKIGVGAGAGAILGGILGGKKGAGQGAIVGGGAGTGVVLATRGKEIRLGPGTDITTHLTAPLTVRMRRS